MSYLRNSKWPETTGRVDSNGYEGGIWPCQDNDHVQRTSYTVTKWSFIFFFNCVAASDPVRLTTMLQEDKCILQRPRQARSQLFSRAARCPQPCRVNRYALKLTRTQVQTPRINHRVCFSVIGQIPQAAPLVSSRGSLRA